MFRCYSAACTRSGGGGGRRRRTVSAADWPGFRGPNRDNISTETGLYRTWPAGGPKVLWKTTVAEGYAGAAIKAGRLYVNDYDEAKKEHAVRCLSMADGKEVWRWSYAVDVRPNHGITRTVPSVGAALVFSLDQKCRLHAIDLKTGKLVWQKNLVQEYKTTIPGWYAGQNPLLDGDRIIVATGGDALAVAFDQATGKEIWRSPNPGKDLMSHSSLMPATIGGVKQYLYLSLNKVSGRGRRGRADPVEHPVRDEDGGRAVAGLDRRWTRVHHERLRGGQHDVPGRQGGVRLHRAQALRPDRRAVQLRGAHAHPLQEPPVRGGIEATRGRFICVGLDGKVVWQSPMPSGDAAATRTFGLGGFLLADGMFFVLDGRSGMLRLIEASTTGYKELASAQILSSEVEEVWGPLALSNGRLVIRDMSQMVCLQVGPIVAGK